MHTSSPMYQGPRWLFPTDVSKLLGAVFLEQVSSRGKRRGTWYRCLAGKWSDWWLVLPVTWVLTPPISGIPRRPCTSALVRRLLIGALWREGCALQKGMPHSSVDAPFCQTSAHQSGSCGSLRHYWRLFAVYFPLFRLSSRSLLSSTILLSQSSREMYKNVQFGQPFSSKLQISLLCCSHQLLQSDCTM